jgi:hypothetical protein
MENHDALLREIAATISICGLATTSRALLRGGAIPPELVERAREIGLVPKLIPIGRDGAPWLSSLSDPFLQEGE